jgi:DNA polymerase I-like protein with 3'-5' exonuclease and polymerase domains
VTGGIQVPGAAVYHGGNVAILREWFQTYVMVIFNAVADLEVLHRELRIQLEDFRRVEDPIQLHNLHFSEWPHDLGFVESLHGRHHRMKHLMDTDFYTYNWGDCLTSGYAYFELRQLQHKDPPLTHIYHTQNMPLLEVRLSAKVNGVRLDRDFLAHTANDLAHVANTARDFVHGMYGLNIGSVVQLTKYLTEVEGMKIPRSRETRNLQFDKDTLAELRHQYLDYDADAERGGISLEQFTMNLTNGGHPLLEARAVFQGHAQLKNHFINALLRPDVPPDKETYEATDFVEYCYPSQHTHTQASGRWSTTEPPLPTLPKKLRQCICAYPEHVLVKFDWDQQELRLNAHLSNDEPTLAAFQRRDDIHTKNTCEIFKYEYPPNLQDPHGSDDNTAWRNTYTWEGKDDKRRTFAKRFVYRIIYRGNPAHAGDIPGAKALGLTSQRLTEASRNYLAAHPALVAYWRKVDADILRTRTVRTFTGRKRYLNGSGTKARAGEVPEICREGTNHPMQGGGVDVFNLTLLAIWRASRDLGAAWLYGSHDSQTWSVPTVHAKEFQARVLDITERPWQIAGRPLRLPVTMEDV